MSSNDTRVVSVMGKWDSEFRRESGVTVCLSGVLFRGADQFVDMVHALPGQVRVYHTEGKRHDTEMLVEKVVADLGEYQGLPINLVGASLGGMEVPFVVQAYREKYPNADPALIHAVLVDAPSGIESMGDPMAKLVQSSKVANTLVKVLPSFVKVPIFKNMQPKWDEISVLAGYQGTDQADEWRKKVQRVVRRQMKGFPASLLISQVNWMVSVARDGLLREACKALEGTRTTYVRCTLANETVLECAVDDWKEMVPHLDYQVINATHVGFYQNMPEFFEFFQELFGIAR